MTTEHRLRRLERTLGTLISWLVVELGNDNTRQLLDRLHAPEDPDPASGCSPTSEDCGRSATPNDSNQP